MKVLFLTLLDFSTLRERNIYTDLLREFQKNHHEVYAISPVERKNAYYQGRTSNDSKTKNWQCTKNQYYRKRNIDDSNRTVIYSGFKKVFWGYYV